MADSHELEPTQAVPPDEAVESKVRAVSQWMKDDPSITEEAVRLIRRLRESRNPPRDASLADTVTIPEGTPSLGTTVEFGGVTTSAGAIGTFGDYEILEKIAQGGMGVVYRARQTKLNRVVALKRIRSAEFADADQVRRFYAEAEAAAKLDHPGIVGVYDVGEVAGEHFYSMAFVDGESLSDRVKRDGPLRPQDAARFIRDASIAVQVAHDAGIVHRDIKPQNLLVERQGQVRVTDFGLAKLQQSDSQLTREGQVLGTPAYMPPEQAAGRHEQVGVPADVYSLGATLYFLLTGRPPFQASTLPETLKQVIENEPAPPRKLDPSIPRDLETICLKALSKESSRRYASGQDLADDLGRWLSGEPIRARRVGRVERAWKWCKRKPVIAGLSAAIVVTLLVGSIVLWERLNASRAAGLVDALASAEPREVPRIIADLEGLRWWTVPRLRQQLATEGDSLAARRLRLHARLALAEDDPSLADTLVEDLLVADLRDVANVRDALGRCSDSQVDRLWTVFRGTADRPKPMEDERFRAGLALAGLDVENQDWQSGDHRFLVEGLLDTNPVFQPVVWDLLRPLRKPLTEPLEAALIDTARSDMERLGAANALADLAADDTARLANLLTYASVEQFDVLFPLVAPSITAATVDSLAEIAATLPPDELGSVDRIAFGQRRANAAVTLLRLGERERVLPVFDWTDDPEALTQFIFRCKSRGVGVESLLELVEQVAAAPDRYPKDARYALSLAIGEYLPSEITASRRSALVRQLADWYAHDPSSGVHGAAGWLLRHLGEQEIIDRVDHTPVPYSPDREWFTLAVTVTPTPPAKAEERPTDEDAGPDEGTEQEDESDSRESAEDVANPAPPESLPPQTFYYTFIVFPAGDYEIGSVGDEPFRNQDETRHPVKLTRLFALLDREITFEELIAFSPKYIRFMQQFKAQSSDAGFGAHWYDSIAYGRWLGTQLGLSEADQAYASPESLDAEQYPREPNPATTWAPLNWPLDLGRHGFRLPTEAEWEVAARAGARTAYGYGSEVALLGRFGWFVENSGRHVHPPRELRPNIRGLFDLHGNLFEWTHDWFQYFGSDAVTDPLGPDGSQGRTMRGAGWNTSAETCRSAYRLATEPTARAPMGGFRLALSLPVANSPAEQGQQEGALPAVGSKN